MNLNFYGILLIKFLFVLLNNFFKSMCICLTPLLASIFFYFFIFILLFKLNILLIFLSLITIIVVLLPSAYISLMERQVVAIIQQRLGPTMSGSIFALFQPILDGLKLFLRNPTFLKNSTNKFLLFMIPIYTVCLALGIWGTIYTEKITTEYYGLILILLILVLSSYGIFISGLLINNKYVTLSIIRSIAIIISYDICIGLIFLIPTILYNGLSISNFSNLKITISIIMVGFPAILMFWIIILSEGRKVPFDIVESESELASGYMIEFSGLGFALLVISEYISVFFLIILFHITMVGNLNIYNILFPLCMYLSFYLIIRTMLPNFRLDIILTGFWKYLFPICMCTYLIITFLLLLIP